MEPFAQVVDAEMFLTYAADEAAARAAFVEHGLPEKGRMRKQPSRKASEFRYTLDGETVVATVVGSVPLDFRDYDPADVELPINGGLGPESPDVLSA